MQLLFEVAVDVGVKRRAKILKVVKWGGLALALLFGAAFGVSAWWRFYGWTAQSVLVNVDRGMLIVGVNVNLPKDALRGWHLSSHAAGLEWKWFYAKPEFGSVVVALPLLWLAVGAGVVAGVGFWMDGRARRRRMAGACGACGYDRMGLACGAACPECGADVTRKTG